MWVARGRYGADSDVWGAVPHEGQAVRAMRGGVPAGGVHPLGVGAGGETVAGREVDGLDGAEAGGGEGVVRSEEGDVGEGGGAAGGGEGTEERVGLEGNEGARWRETGDEFLHTYQKSVEMIT